MTEYVKIYAEEMEYGKKNLLEAQLSLINMIKNFSKYKEVRLENSTLKINLKSKISLLQESLNALDKILPEEIHHHKEDIFKEIKMEKQSHSLESEIDEIKRKLSLLQS